MKILILGGGDSPEREVSLRSAGAVAAAAKTAGFEVLEIDPKYDLDKLDEVSKDTLIFPILHGKNGEDGVIQKALEDKGFAYLGSDSQVSKRCFDKWETRLILEAQGLPMPKAERVNRQSYEKSELAKRPHVLKILHGGSSIGTLMVRDPSNIESSQLDEIFQMEADAVLEELIEGIEVTTPILDQSALPSIEVRPPEGGEFDYENKYNGQSAELCPPPSLSDGQHAAARKLAETVHETMGCRHLSRVDKIMRPDGSFVVLEINTIPGLTDQSLYPKSAAVSGLDMPALVSRFADMVKRDYSI